MTIEADHTLDATGLYCPEPVMLLQLAPGRKLARADAQQVLAAIEEQGFYLQMPPTPDELRRRDGAT